MIYSDLLTANSQNPNASSPLLVHSVLNLNNWKIITHLCHSYGQSLAYYNFTLIALTFNLSTELWLDYKQQKNLHTFMSSSRRRGVSWSACWKLTHKTTSIFIHSLVRWARSNSSIHFSTHSTIKHYNILQRSYRWCPDDLPPTITFTITVL
jgi:hypothetical protein